LETKTKSMSFSTNPQRILLVGAGFLGKYFLTRMFEGYEAYMLNKAKENGVASHGLPLATIIDKQNPDSLYQFPLLQNYDKKGYSKYLWQSMGDTSSLQQQKIAQSVDAVVITGAIADVPYAMKSPLDTYQTNVMNTLSLMEYLRVNDFQGKIINMSSESVLGHQEEDKLPLKEDLVPNPANIYGTSKLAQEQIVLTYARSYGLNATCLRSATLYGPFGRTKQAIPIFVKQILNREKVSLDGDGSNSRDFVYVEDTARAIELALYTDKNIKGEIINIGSGKETKFSSLINLIAHTIGYTKEDGYVVGESGSDSMIDYRPFREGEKGLRVFLDIKKARELLNYEPQIPMTGVDSSGLKSTIEWVANWVLNFDEKEMDLLREKMYPLRYDKRNQMQSNTDTSSSIQSDDIQVSV
jgi:nucleoside-diphosphate-sugar epimerase